MFNSLIHTISRFDANHRLMVASITASGAFLLVYNRFDGAVGSTMVWITFALTVLMLMWITIFRVHPRDLPQLSRLEDSSRLLILIFVLAAAVASLFAVFFCSIP